MCDEDLTKLLNEPFKLVEGAEYFIVHSPDNNKHYVNHVHSSGFPMKVLELHSKDNDRVVATVFSYNMGMRFMIVFGIEDIRAL